MLITEIKPHQNDLDSYSSKTKDELINSLVSKIEGFYKKGSYDICPSCKKQTIIRTNPMYMHICENCGWEGNYMECKNIYPSDLVQQLLSNIL